jgi:hypothetical protein
MLGSRWQLRRRAEPARGMGSALVLIALFSALVAINRFLCVNAYHNTAFWPANGVLVVAMLILPARRCSVVLVACLAIDIVIELYTGETIFDSCVYSSLSIVASHMVARLTRRFCGAATDLTRFRRLASFAGRRDQ